MLQALVCPVKEVKTALTIFPACIQVLGHLSVPDTRNLSYSDYTLTRSPVSTILALTLSVPESLSSVPLCPAPPLPGPAPSRLRQLLPVCADSGSCGWSVCPVPIPAQSVFPDLRSLPFPLLVLNIVLPAASPKTELTLSNLA